jgi:hypothetical protein
MLAFRKVCDPRSIPFRCSFAECVDGILSAHDQHSLRERGCRHQRLAHRVLRQQLVLSTGLDDENIAIFTCQVQSTVGRNR